MAIPMKRQMINIEQLRFPSGIAAAETLRALHSHGEKGIRAAKALGIAGILAAVNKFWAEGLKLVSDKLRTLIGSTQDYGALPGSRHGSTTNETVFGSSGSGWAEPSSSFNWDPVFLAAGALTGLRVSASMMLGGTLCWAVFVANPPTPRRRYGDGLSRRSRHVDSLGRRCLHGHLRPALVCDAMAERAAAFGNLWKVLRRLPPRAND